MKRFVLLAVLLCGSLSLSAQNKGDKYIAGSFGLSFGNQEQELSDGVFSTTASQPLSTTLSLQAEIGYFIADNLRVGLALGVPFNSSPSNQTDDGTWLKTNTLGLEINPSIAYYVKMAENLYYTPEIGGTYEFGFYKEQLTKNNTYNADYSGWSLYFNFLALEYRVNEKFALGVGIGTLGYVSAKIKDPDSDAFLGTSQFVFNFNSASVSARIYF